MNISNPLSSIIDLGGKILDKFIPDPMQAAQAKLALIQAEMAGELEYLKAELQLAQGQLDVNKVEAASPLLFVSGWRPFIGWICGLGLAYQFLFRTIFMWVIQVVAWWQDKDLSAFPIPVNLDMGTLLTLLGGLLGLGALRTVEKVKRAD